MSKNISQYIIKQTFVDDVRGIQCEDVGTKTKGGQIMSKLNKLIQELCPNGVENRKLGEVCEFCKWIFPSVFFSSYRCDKL